LIAAALKAVDLVRQVRGFESLPLRSAKSLLASPEAFGKIELRTGGRA
jgi:hypothetical protein